MFKKILGELLLLSVIFLVVDLGFLRMLIPYWNKQLIQIQGTPLLMNYIAAGLAYFTLIVGLYYFIIRSHEPVINAMLLGWFVYFVYELTNKAIISKWNWQTVVIDGIWGGILFGLTTWIFYYIKSKMN